MAIIGQKNDIFSLGYDRDLLRSGADDFYNATPAMANVFSDAVSTGLISSGEFLGNTVIKDGYLQSDNFVSVTSGWQLTPTSAEINVSTAILSLDIPDATTANSFHTNSTGNSWWGCNVADFASDNDNATAYVLSTGEAKVQNMTIAGTSSILLGSSTNIFKANSTDGIWLGHGTFASAPFSVSIAGAIKSTSGTIGGWILAATTLANHATPASANVLIDSTNSLIRLGPTAGAYISIDGANQKIESSDYVSGMAGSGFTLSPARLEIGTIVARGMIRTAVFQKDIISAVGGNFIVLESDMLNEDMTAADAQDVKIYEDGSWSTGDVLRIKDTTNDEWFEITGVVGAPDYEVTRDLAGDYGAGANPPWKKGATVVNYGQSGDGGVYMTASDTNAPYLSVFSHAGAPWTTTTTHLRIGNLNGYLGYAADTYGIGIGSSSANQANLTFDTTNGIRLRIATTDKIVLDNSGNVTITGTITATDGAIGGWTLSANAIYLDSGTDATSSGMASADYPFYAGKEYASRATAPFRVTPAGALVATSATITGVITVSATSSGIASFSDAGALATEDTADFDTLVSGAEKPADNATVGATFGVNVAGGGAGNNQVGNDGLITTITDTAITVTNLAAINADLGTVTAGSITTDVLIVGTDVVTAESRFNTLFDRFVFIGNSNDGLTETPGAGGSITRSLMITYFGIADGVTCKLVSASLGTGLNWDDDFEFVAPVRTATQNKDIFVGLSPDNANVPANATSIVRHIGFFWEDNTLYASNADSSTQTKTEITGLTLTNWNVYRFVWDAGTNIKFYVNDVLKATHTTNLPSGTEDQLPKIWIGAWGVGATAGLWISNNYSLFMTQI